jgi:hypothetical protein
MPNYRSRQLAIPYTLSHCPGKSRVGAPCHEDAARLVVAGVNFNLRPCRPHRVSHLKGGDPRELEFPTNLISQLVSIGENVVGSVGEIRHA